MYDRAQNYSKIKNWGPWRPNYFLLQYGVTVSIKGFHPLDPGSTPGIGNRVACTHQKHAKNIHLAQLVEHQAFNLVVTGSSPVMGIFFGIL